jgi:hypothetical protein
MKKIIQKDKQDPIKNRVGVLLSNEKPIEKLKFINPSTIAADTGEDLLETLAITLGKRGSAFNVGLLDTINSNYFITGLEDVIKQANFTTDEIAMPGVIIPDNSKPQEKEKSFVRKAINPSKYPAQTMVAVGLATLAQRLLARSK